MAHTQHTNTAARGFTLVEVLLSVAIIAVIAGFSLPVYRDFQIRDDLDVAATTIVQSFRRAQTLSQAVESDSRWGAYLEQGSVTIFKGAGYAMRDASLDEITEISDTITITGMQEVVYSKLFGDPGTIGVVTLTALSGDTRTISVGQKGTITW